ncbi:hypothetical protein ACIP1T_28400 [Pseudomonas japonica]|uniref:hypothetical protein n=1 Tax=Pseudomonas japonica TaxID=256466 RepID=UPI003816B1AB
MTSYVYDALGRQRFSVDALGYSESYTYDAFGNRSSLTNKNGQTWNYRYDQAGQLLEEITPTVYITRVDGTGWPNVQQPVSLVTRYGYDAFGSVTSRSEGRLRATVNSDPALDDASQARTSIFGYDALGRQVRITSPGWYNRTSGQYQQNSDGSANTFQVTTEVMYDALGNAVRNRVRINNTGVAASDFVDSYKAYDLLGQVRYEVDALRGVSTYEYDGFGQAVLTRRYAAGLNAVVPVSGYYQPGDFNAATLPPSPGNDRTIATRYDRLGRKTEVQQDLVTLYAFTGNVATSALKDVAPVKTYSYNPFGQVTRETLLARDSAGNSVMEQISTVNYYDLAGQRIGTVDALGYYTRLEYNGSGKVSRQVEYATALSGWGEAAIPAPVASARDRSVRFVYDNADRLVQTVQENVTYWRQTVPAMAVTGDVVVSRSTYDGVGNVLTLTNAEGHVTTTAYNALGQVVQVTEPARYTARAGAVNPFENAVYASPTTVYGIDAFGQVVYEQRIVGAGQAGVDQVTRTVFDAAGHLISELDAGGSVQDFKVDVAGRRVEETRQIYSILTGWRTVGQMIRRTYSYDSLGQQLSTSDWYEGGAKVTTNSVLYNRFGEITAELLNGNYKASYAYDQLGNATWQTNAQGTTRIDYDLTGKASRSMQLGDLNNATDDRITYVRNDLLGRMLEQHLPAFEANLNVDTLNNVNLILTTPIIRQASDRWGNVLTRIDPRGYVTTYTYNQNNQVLTETLPETDILRENGSSYRASLTHEKRYDALGQLIVEADLIGGTVLRTRQHAYNAAGELVQDTDALGNSRYYAMDTHGNRVGTSDELGTVTFDEYDAMDRHVRHGVVRNGARVVLLTNQYDQAGRLVAEIDGSATVTETLVSTQQANGTSVVTGVAGNTRFTRFDERGNIVETRNESNVEKRFVFNEANRKVAEVDGLQKSLTWTYNEGDYGRLTSHKDLGNRNFSYVYNAFGQVVAENGDKTYVYYRNGLLKSVTTTIKGTDNNGDPQKFLSNWWQSVATSSYLYDGVGNRVSDRLASTVTTNVKGSELYLTDQETRYRFDEQGRLVGVHALSGNMGMGAGVVTYLKTTNAKNGTVNYTPTFHYGFNSTADTSLSYKFDEFGNRRQAWMNTKSPSAVTTVLDNWFKYDANDRVIVADGFSVNGSVVAGINKGYTISYDKAGRRASSEQWIGKNGTNEKYQRSQYVYNDQNQVVRSLVSDVTRQSGGNTSATALTVSEARLALYNEYDERGRVVMQATYQGGVAQGYVQSGYRGDDQKIVELSYTYSNSVARISQATYFGETGMFDEAGNQTAYRYVAYNGSGVEIQRGDYRTEYAGFESYKAISLTARTSLAGWISGTTGYVYSDRGDLLHLNTNGARGTRRFALNGDGQIVGRWENIGVLQNYLYYQNAALANAGNASAPTITNTLTSISADYPAHAPSSYQVKQGDTFQTIAQTVWGDSRMWYLIADANGKDAAQALVAGTSLRIPNVVSSTHNTATTFKPYNPNEVIGDTITPPQAPKPKKKKCNAVASIVMVVVAVVVAVYTAGAGAAAFASASSTATGTAAGIGATATAAGGYATIGTAALTGGSIAGIGTGAMIGGAIVGAAVGSAASQLAGMAMGAVDKFSWRQVAASGVTAGIVSGVGTLAATAKAGSWAKTATDVMKGKDVAGYSALGVFNYATSQVANRVVGLETSFSWSGMTASVVGANLAGYAGRHIEIDGFPGAIVRGQISAAATATINDKWFGGARPDYAQVAADAFGNVLANAAFAQLKPKTELEFNSVSLRDSRYTNLRASVDPDQLLGYQSTDRPADVAGKTTLDALWITDYPLKISDVLPDGPSGQGLDFDVKAYDGFHLSNVDSDVPELPETDPITGRFVTPPDRKQAFSDRVREFYDDHAVVPLVKFNGDLAHDAAAVVANTHIVRANSLPLLLGAADDLLAWAGFGGLDRLSPGPSPKTVMKVEIDAVKQVGPALNEVGTATAVVLGYIKRGYRSILDSVHGKIIFEADALTPGPLGDDLMKLPGTFSGGRYATVELEESLIAYRAWTPGQSREYGAFWSLEKPLGSLMTRIDSALLPEWGGVAGTNFRAQATQYTKIEIPKGTIIHVGEVGSQGGAWIGSGSQLVIDGGASEVWKIGQGVLK